MRKHRTIPLDLEDWLQNFGASLDSQAFANEFAASSEQKGEWSRGLAVPESLSVVDPIDNILHSLAV